MASARHLAQYADERGATVVAQGDEGDRYYVVDEGEVDVVIDGAVVTRLVPGDGFGELALLRDAPRAASVVARGPVRMLTLDRDAFLTAVTSHAGATRAADAVMAGYRRPAMATAWPLPCNVSTIVSLSSGLSPACTSSMPSRAATALAVVSLSPVAITILKPRR